MRWVISAVLAASLVSFTSADPRLADSDGDSCPDTEEDLDGDGVVSLGETDPLLAGDCRIWLDDAEVDGLPDLVDPGEASECSGDADVADRERKATVGVLADPS